MLKSLAYRIAVLSLTVICFGSINPTNSRYLKMEEKSRIVLIGSNLCSRMMNFGYFETEVQMRYPDSELFIRNMCDGGDTPGFRPHASRNDPWAFPGADKFQTEYAKKSGSEGHMDAPDQWITRLKADVILAFFGYSESFQGPAGLTNFKKELEAFILHTKAQKYNGVAAPQLALVSPIAFENLSKKIDVPNGIKENKNLALYTAAIREVANKHAILFIDAFNPTKQWFDTTREPLTIDGSQLNDEGYRKLSLLLADQVWGPKKVANESVRQLVKEAVLEKNWMWHNDIKIPNGVHVYGRRYDPFGPDNYPAEIEKIRQMTDIRDKAIWAALKGKKTDLEALDKNTLTLPPVKTNYNPDKNGSLTYLYGNDALSKLKVPEGYKIELFASEQEFPELAKPMQMSFDNKGRLWIATMPSYPHYKPGDGKPDDKIIILEDTNGDGKADKSTIFAEGLHLPVGFEIEHDGVYVSQGTNLKKLIDTDGDGKADKVEILLSGFDDHDTHHNIHAFCADPSGSIYMGEGVFLHTDVETSYGTVRATNGGFYRYNPVRHHLERTAQLSIPNPWGIAFDHWGQPFFAETSGPDVRWMLPGTVLPRYGEYTDKSFNLIEDAHKVRPTSGLEFVSSRHFPDQVQGDMLINNTIGFLGTKQHAISDSGTGFQAKFRQNLLVSDDRNFRPVDMEFAPDGSLYVIDWHNILIGHMQHNARDPLRDHMHGRVYRITYPSRPLVKPAVIAGASIDQLLENLKLPEYRSRYRTKRELRGRKAADVLPKLTTWVNNLDKNDPQYEHNLLEALWVSWGLNKVDQPLLKRLLKAKDYRVRAAAVMAVRYNGHQLPDQTTLLAQAAADPNGRVRLAAITAASWLPKQGAQQVLKVAGQKPMDAWISKPYETAIAHVNGVPVTKKESNQPKVNLTGDALALFREGKIIYEKEGYCGTCHQPNGKGLPDSGFPPLTGTSWVTGSETRLIKLVLNGLLGPLEVAGKKYPGQVPMTPFKGMLNDREVAAVLTFVRNSFGNTAAMVTPQAVAKVRSDTKDKSDFYLPADLLKAHPLEK